MPAKGFKKQFCKRGHKLVVVGQYNDNSCRLCSLSTLQMRRAEAKKWISEFKIAQGCVDCLPSNRYIWQAEALDFDHLGDKKFSMANWTGGSRETLLQEIAKWEAVCSNHHRGRTAKRNQRKHYDR